MLPNSAAYVGVVKFAAVRRKSLVASLLRAAFCGDCTAGTAVATTPTNKNDLPFRKRAEGAQTHVKAHRNNETQTARASSLGCAGFLRPIRCRERQLASVRRDDFRANP